MVWFILHSHSLRVKFLVLPVGSCSLLESERASDTSMYYHPCDGVPSGTTVWTPYILCLYSWLWVDWGQLCHHVPSETASGMRPLRANFELTL